MSRWWMRRWTPWVLKPAGMDQKRAGAGGGAERPDGDRLCGGRYGHSGLYVVEDPGGVNEDAKKGMLKLRIGKGWSKSLHFHTGQAPVLQYNRQLMQAILHDRLPIAKIVNATVIPLDQAPKGYEDFDKGAAKKFVLNPNGLIKAKKAA